MASGRDCTNLACDCGGAGGCRRFGFVVAWTAVCLSLRVLAQADREVLQRSVWTAHDFQGICLSGPIPELNSFAIIVF